jgi:3-oxoacyl-[acyl-carrier-protein] synthase III
MPNSYIAGLGHFIPERKVTNKDLEKIMDTTDEWIVERTGINSRHWADIEKDSTSNMGTRAALKALENADLKPADVDFIIFCTLSPDYSFPGGGVMVQEQLGIDTIGALDIRNQCSGFVYGLSVADQFIKSGMYKTVLVIGSEIHSTGLDKTTRGRNVSVIFGDGAGAAVLRATDKPGQGILSTHLHSQGKFAEELVVMEPSSRSINRMEYLPEQIFPIMNGSNVFKHAVTRFPEVIMEALNKNGYTPSDINLLIPHQANLRISQFIQKTMKLSDDQVYNNIMRYGNTTAASVPIALSEAWQEGKVKEGDLICLAAFGSGFTWASALIRW